MSVASPVIDFIDPVNRRIHLRSGVTAWHPVDDIYTEVRNLRRTDESLRPYDMFCEALPLVDKGGGKFTGRALILLGGTLIVPFDEDATHTITGELIGDGKEGAELIDTTIQVSKININYQPPPSAEYILTFNEEVNSQSFEDQSVLIDAADGEAGTLFPIGTPPHPSSNLVDAVAIAQERGFNKYIIDGNLDIDVTTPQATTWRGFGAIRTIITLDAAASVVNHEFQELQVGGEQNGLAVFRDCRLNAISGFSGVARDCFYFGPLTVADDAALVGLYNCTSIIPGTGKPVLDFGNSDCDAQIRNWVGGLKIENFNTGRSMSIDVGSGSIEIDASCTDGTIVIRGICSVIDNSGAGCDVLRQGTLSDMEMTTLDIVKAAVAGRVVTVAENDGSTTLSIYDDDGVTVARTLNVSADKTERIVA